MAFLPGLLAAGMSSGFIPGLIQRAGNFVSGILGGLSRGQTAGESARESARTAIQQFAGVPAAQSQQGAALQDMNLSNNLPVYVPRRPVNQLQPRRVRELEDRYLVRPMASEERADREIARREREYAQVNPRSSLRSQGGFTGMSREPDRWEPARRASSEDQSRRASPPDRGRSHAGGLTSRLATRAAVKKNKLQKKRYARAF